MDDDWTRSMKTMAQVGLTIVIPERTRILPSCDMFHRMKWCPGAMRVFGGTHKKSLIGGAKIHIEQSVVITHGRCPRATGIMLVAVPSRFVEMAVYLTDIVPVNHIFGFQHLHAHKVEIGSHHIVFLAVTDHVGIGVVDIQYWVDVGSIALIAPTLGIYTHKVGTGIILSRQHLNIIEVHIAGMS